MLKKHEQCESVTHRQRSPRQCPRSHSSFSEKKLKANNDSVPENLRTQTLHNSQVGTFQQVKPARTARWYTPLSKRENMHTLHGANLPPTVHQKTHMKISICTLQPKSPRLPTFPLSAAPPTRQRSGSCGEHSKAVGGPPTYAQFSSRRIGHDACHLCLWRLTISTASSP